MPYSVPPRWSHGGTPTAALLNVYSDDLNFLNSLFGNAINPVVMQQQHLNTGDDLQQGDTTKIQGGIWSIHQYRWLHYRTISSETGTIVDPAGVGEDVSLDDQTTGSAVFDLAEVSWLVQGRVYKITGIVFAVEDYAA